MSAGCIWKQLTVSQSNKTVLLESIRFDWKHPNAQELHALQEVLLAFGHVSGLTTNVHKSEIFAVPCGGDLQAIPAPFAAKLIQFPGKYLGLPLYLRSLRRADEQFILDKVASRVVGWKGRLMTSSKARPHKLSPYAMPCLLHFNSYSQQMVDF